MTERLLPIAEVCRLTGLSRRSVYYRGERGTFPRPVRVLTRTSRWVGSEVDAWVREQVRAGRVERDSGTAR